MLDRERSPLPAALRLRRAFRPVLRLAGRAVLLLVGFVTLYIGLAFGAAFIPVNRDFVPPATGIDIFIATNGVHTDIVLPARAAGMDWREIFSLGDLGDPAIAPAYIGFGWGDRAFYLETRRWQDLRPDTALKALFGLGPSVLHVVWQGRPIEAGNIRRVRIAPVQLAHLIRYIRAALITDAAGRPIAIPGAAYHAHDAFMKLMTPIASFSPAMNGCAVLSPMPASEPHSGRHSTTG
jgi:uncharacterized protein (TIGR02117 family)